MSVLKNRINKILNSPDFRDFVERQIGFIRKVEVNYSKKTVLIMPFVGDGRCFPFETFLEFEGTLLDHPVKKSKDL